jgi:3-oxoisoapionate kinase
MTQSTVLRGHAPAFGFYGDDFTGATDTLAHLARAGLRTMLFLEPPTRQRLATLDASGSLDAIGVAGAARALAPAAMREELLRVGARFAELGVRVMHYKVCSTFDSGPSVGSIGTAVATLREFFANRFVPVVGGQPDLQRYCAFGHLFAAAASGGQGEPRVHRIDRHPTMSRHPVTPMGESDLRLHLQAQGLTKVDSIDWRRYALSSAALETIVAERLESQPDALLFDVLENSHLLAIGRLLIQHAARAPLLAVGASSVAQAYAMARERATLESHDACAAPTQRALPRAEGTVFVLAGSLSPMTAAQIDAARSFVRIELDPAQMTGAFAQAYLEARVDEIADALRRQDHVLAFTGRKPSHAASGDADRQRSAVAAACAMLVREVVGAVRLRRIGIAGGDTSSFAVKALKPWGLSYLAPLSSGVTVCRLHVDQPDRDGMDVMLKGGQMGDVDLFEQLLTGHV